MERHKANRTTLFMLGGLLLTAFAFGGGGIGAPRANLLVQIAALVMLALHRESVVQFWRESPRLLRAVVAISLLLPLIQIVPLPPALWTALPASGMIADSLQAAGLVDVWMPMSVDPVRTMLALSALVTPIAVVWAGWALPRERLIDCGWLIVALGLLTVLIGLFQVTSSSEVFTPFGTRAPGDLLLGTFANRNSTALFLGFALALATLLPSPIRHPAALLIRIGICVLLVVAIVLTKSRTGQVLALLPILLGLVRGLQTLLPRRQGRSVVRTALVGLGAAGLVLCGLGTMIVAAPGRVAASLERFEAKDDARRFIWDDATYSAKRYWPVGVGMGTFESVSLVDESLENMTKRRAGRAHNDYLELAIEAGAFGLATALLWAILIGWLSWRARYSSYRWAAWSGSVFLTMIAAQSITDYPLRNQSILAFAAFALLLLTRISTMREEKPA